MTKNHSKLVFKKKFGEIAFERSEFIVLSTFGFSKQYMASPSMFPRITHIDEVKFLSTADYIWRLA